MRGLVTGYARFLGSHLVDTLLIADYEVVEIDCFTDYHPKEIKAKGFYYKDFMRGGDG